MQPNRTPGSSAKARSHERLVLAVIAGIAVAVIGGIVVFASKPPDYSRQEPVLESGSIAVVVGERNHVLCNAQGGMLPVRLLAPGVRVRIGHDPGAGPEAPTQRLVSVTVETGEYRDQSGQVDRAALAPLK